MNDRLTFRVYSKTRKKYYFINKDNYELDTDIVKEGIEDWDTGENTFIYYKYCELLFADDEDFVKEFSTGLNDKNDKPIFENDYVKSGQWTPNTYIVKFIEGKYCLCDIKSGEYRADIDMIYDSTGCQFEVCGNLHENPEILEVK